MSQTTLQNRAVDVTFRLLSQAFGPNGEDTVTLSGLRVHAEVTQARFPTAESATVRIEGMTPDVMNRLSMAAPDPTRQSASELILTTQDGAGGNTLIFQGGVTLAYVDYTTAPNVAFVAQAFSTVLPNAMTATPTGYRGAVSAGQVLATIASKAGLSLHIQDVAATLHDPYFHGSPGQQLTQCLETVPLCAGLGRGQLSVWPATSAASQPTPLGITQALSLSAETGLIGYPAWSAGGLALRMLFNPLVSFNSLIALHSRYQPAGWGQQNGPVPVGLWRAIQVRHTLQTETPHGAWFTDIVAQAYREPTA
ncbi:baseplate hub protein [Acetobacter sp. KSO5]|uniref:baseplate hub protein n=1 Tax=Acetobacter sp. KSO5 TaxID=3373674 RepID=UPI00376EE1BD